MVSLLLVRQEVSVSGSEPSKQTFRVKRPIGGPRRVVDGPAAGDPSVPLVDLNFINGFYKINGVEFSAGDVIDHPEYIDGTGLAIPTGGLVTSVIGEALANWPLGNWTGILRWNNFASAQTFTPLVINDSGHDSGFQLSRQSAGLTAQLEDFDGASTRQANGGLAGAGQHTAAMTREDTLLALSLDGGSVAGNNAPSFGISPTFASFGGFPSGPPVFDSAQVGVVVSPFLTDLNGNSLAVNGPGDILTIYSLETSAVRVVISLGFTASGVIISSFNDVLVGNVDTGSDLAVYDLETGALKQVVSGLAFTLPVNKENCSCETKIGGISYILMSLENKLNCLSNAGAGWALEWSLLLVGIPEILTCGPNKVYWSEGDSEILHYSDWSPTSGSLVDHTLIPPGLGVESIRAAYYDQASDNVCIVGNRGHIFIYSSDMGTLLRSISNGGWFASGIPDQLMSRRMLGSPGIMVFAAPEDSRIVEYRISDLALVAEYGTTAGSGTWGINATGFLSGVSSQYGAVWEPNDDYLLYLPPKAVIGDALTIECLRIYAPQDSSELPGMSRQSCGPFVPPVPPPLVTEGQFSVLTGNFLQVIDLIGPAPLPDTGDLRAGPDDRREKAIGKLAEWD